MFTSRFSKISTGLLILVVAFVSVSFVTSNISSKQVFSKNSSASAAVYLDYAQRHPELSNLASPGKGASDYAERHPELSANAQSSVDLNDYFFRHLND